MTLVLGIILVVVLLTDLAFRGFCSGITDKSKKKS